MRYNWLEYFAFAAGLLKQVEAYPEHGLTHAMRRIIISRAYYAAYHTAKAYVEEQRWPLDGDAGPHMRYITPFVLAAQRTADKNTKRKYLRIGRKLGPLKELRVKADYKNEAFSIAETRRAVQTARSIINLIRGLRGLDPLPE